jgi:hypothetical protein
MDSIHADLRPYTPLMHWLRLMDRKSFISLAEVYTGSLNKPYNSVIRQFFEEARSRLASGSLRRGKFQHFHFDFKVTTLCLQVKMVTRMQTLLAQLQAVQARLLQLPNDC